MLYSGGASLFSNRLPMQYYSNNNIFLTTEILELPTHCNFLMIPICDFCPKFFVLFFTGTTGETYHFPDSGVVVSSLSYMPQIGKSNF